MARRDTVLLPSGFINDLAASASRTAVLTAIAAWMPAIIEGERSSIALPASNSPEMLEIYAMADSLILAKGTLLPIADSLVGKAFSTQRVVNEPDLTAAATYAESPALIDFGMRSILVCPLVIGGRSLGTVNLGNSKVGFFTKEHETLFRSIADLVASFMGVHERAESERERASTDHLTLTLSRSAILDHLHRSFENKAQGDPSLLYLDVDRFKIINDTHGHSWGDEVLRILAHRIGRLLRPSDRIGRLGGDEFLVVIANDPDGKIAAGIAAEIGERCSDQIVLRSVRVNPSMSIGIASPTASTDSAEDLLHDADRAMYSAKTSSRSVAVADAELREHAAMIATIDRDLDHGMRSGAICFHYQPIRELPTRSIRGAEALVRWSHPRLGMIPAPLMIERLEATGRTDLFTQWSLQTIMTDWSHVQTELPWFLNRGVSINLTPRQLGWDGYADLHLAQLEEFGFCAQELVVEVVESSEIEINDPAEATLQKLGEAGVMIALDDFGTGHNALSYFTRFPIHAIKFDRSLVSVASESFNARTILAGLTQICCDLGVLALGEGIETEVDATLCEDLGMTRGQGWHFGYPVPLMDFIATTKAEGPTVDDLARFAPTDQHAL